MQYTVGELGFGEGGGFVTAPEYALIGELLVSMHLKVYSTKGVISVRISPYRLISAYQTINTHST